MAGSNCLSRNLVVSIGHLIYTPEDIKAKQIIENDRPYAGYLYSSLGYHTRSDNKLDTIEFSLGLIGPSSQGQQAQDFIHELRDFEKFNGWDNQLNNEVTINVLYEHKQRFFRNTTLTKRLQHDLIAHTGISLGTVATHINTGFEYRIGLHLPDDFGTASVRPGGDSASPGRNDLRLRPKFINGLHVFLAADSRLVARDIFLDGNTFEDSHGVDKKTVVADIALGFNFISGQWKFSYAQVWRTKEFKLQEISHE
jgi:lipid A 3-O-deacylase